MPSKFISKSFVRDEIIQATRTARCEVIDLIERSLSEFKDTNELGKYPENMKLLVQLKNNVSAVSRDLSIYNDKLSMLVEGGIRSVVLLEKGEPWVKSVTVKSAIDVVAFVQEALKETTAWRDRALTAITDLLRSPGNVTRLVVVLSAIISKTNGEQWSELRSLITLYPWYKLVLVRLSDGARQDWDLNAYDATTYAVEHEPLPNNLARMIRTAPFWLQDILRSLSMLYQPLYKELPSSRYRNYDKFVETEASLACLVNLSDTLYEDFQVDFPAHVLEWDMAGSMHVSEDDELFLDGGEIKSSQRLFGDGKWQLERRMRLLSLVLRTIMPNIKHTTATGTVFAPANKKNLDATFSQSDRTPNLGNSRSSETRDTGNISYTIHFRLLNEYY